MIDLIKFTRNGETHKGTKWGPGVTHELPPCPSPRLCSTTVIHTYRSVNLGLLTNRIHGAIPKDELVIYTASAPEIVADDGLKVGVFELTTHERVPVPGWYLDEKLATIATLRFALLSADALPQGGYYPAVVEAVENTIAAILSGDKKKLQKAAEAAWAAAREDIDFALLADSAVGMAQADMEVNA